MNEEGHFTWGRGGGGGTERLGPCSVHTTVNQDVLEEVCRTCGDWYVDYV